MTVKKETKQNYIVKVINIIDKSNIKGPMYRIYGEKVGFENGLLDWYDGWDELAYDIKNNVQPGDILIIEAAEYQFPQGGMSNKIYRYKDYTTSYESTIFITNDKCSRGIKNKTHKCFCGKDITNINKKSVYHFYLPNNLSNYVLKDKKCKIIGNYIRDLDKHKNILVREINWVI